MARGKKFNNDIKEKAFALLSTNNNIAEVSRMLGIKENTLRTWKKSFEIENPTDATNLNLVELRSEKKKEFVQQAWEDITKAQQLLSRRLERALESEDEIDSLIDEIMELDYQDLSKEQRKSLFKKASSIKVEDVSKIAIVLGTLYDKQALASNENTVNVGGTTLEELLKKVEGKGEY